MPSINLAQLKDRTWSRVDYNEALYPSQEVTDAINECTKVLNALVGFSMATIPVNYVTQKNRVWYDVPAGVAIPTKVQVDGKYLKPSNLLQIGRARPNWLTETTSNQLQNISTWVRCGVKKFGIWPADSIGGQQLTVTGVAEVPPLVSDTDFIKLNNDSQAAFDLLAFTTIVLKESPKMFAQSSVGYQEFLRIVKAITHMNGYKAPAYFVAELQQPQKRG